jgi:hypothetical protein
MYKNLFNMWTVEGFMVFFLGQEVYYSGIAQFSAILFM